MLDRKAELDSLVLNVAFATGIAADQVPNEFTECNKDGVNYCTESRNQHIPSPTEWTLDSEAAYVHYCANETMERCRVPLHAGCRRDITWETCRLHQQSS